MKYSGHRKLLCELSKLSKLNAFILLGFLFTNSAQREENWFQCVRRVYATVILHYILGLEDGRGCRGAMISAKITSEPPDLQNDLQAPRNCLPAFVTSPSLPPFCLHASHFGLRLLFLFFV